MLGLNNGFILGNIPDNNNNNSTLTSGEVCQVLNDIFEAEKAVHLSADFGSSTHIHAS